MNRVSVITSVDAARAVKWPFKEFRGQPIGALLDNGSIALKDLGFAAERAYDEKVREAAKTLLLSILSQQQDSEINSPTKMKPLNVISSEYRSFAERRQLQFALFQGAISGFIVAIPSVLTIQMAFFRDPTNTQSQRSLDWSFSSQEIISIAIAVLILLGMLGAFLKGFDWILSKLDRQIQLHRKGQQGEERVMNAMYFSLDEQWWLFRNLSLPGQNAGDIDFVLVSSKGIWALEAKALDGEYRNVGDKWERRFSTAWLPAFTNPSKQAKRNAASLNHVLQTHNIKQWVNPAVIWANQDSALTVESPSVFIWKLDQVGNELRKLHEARPISEQQVKEIVETLKGFYERPILAGGSVEI